MKPQKLLLVCLTESFDDKDQIRKISATLDIEIEEVLNLRELSEVRRGKNKNEFSPIYLLGVQKIKNEDLMRLRKRFLSSGQPYGVVVGGHHSQREEYKEFINPHIEQIDRKPETIFTASGIIFERGRLLADSLYKENKYVDIPKPWRGAILWSMMHFEFNALSPLQQNKLLKEIGEAKMIYYRARKSDYGLTQKALEELANVSTTVKGWLEKYNYQEYSSLMKKTA